MIDGIGAAARRTIFCLLLFSTVSVRPVIAGRPFYSAPVPTPLRIGSNDGSACQAAAEQAEQEQGLPSGLLLAVGQEESGRWDLASGQVLPWPFAINAAGESRFFQTMAEAVDFVVSRQRSGTQSIDVGCFQINLRYHPGAFATLQDAFDPLANARYAARFLKSLQAQTGSWDAAVGRYHSATNSLAAPYAAAVFNFWRQPFSSRTIEASLAVPWRQVIAGVIVQRPGAMPSAAGVVAYPGNLPRVITPTVAVVHALPAATGRRM